ncbi:hypothetical protein ABZ611_07605 [Streptomyces sp. NPDC007861]
MNDGGESRALTDQVRELVDDHGERLLAPESEQRIDSLDPAVRAGGR